jgi:type II secretory pathway predicted ATPase ExeA
MLAPEHDAERFGAVVEDLTSDPLSCLRGHGPSADMDSHSPFACLLVGQPTLRRRIKLGTFAALDQRIALRYTMTGMSEAETKSYLAHHLKLAGRCDTLFSDDAVALIHQVSRGIPRAVNNLAVQALVAAFATNKTIVDESSARSAVTEVTTE